MDANIAHYCLHKLKKWPHEYMELDENEKAYVIASVQIKIEADKREAEKLKNKTK